MPNNRANLEIVYEGWLTKSPPSKPIWKARWRRRWFILRHSGELPGQYFLEYYTDRNCRKLKGKIDLDQCDQIDAGFQFQNNKQIYHNMFDLKTPKRTYFLAAETDEEMKKWVEYICHVCHLIAFKDETEEFDYGIAVDDRDAAMSLGNRTDDTESPPVSPTSTTSGPYIPISECISGKPLSSPNGLEELNNMLRQGGGYLIVSSTMRHTPPNAPQSRVKTYSHASRQGQGRLTYNEPSALHRTPLLPFKRPDVQTGNDLRSDEFYDSPRQLHPAVAGTPPTSPTTTDGESVFTDDEWVGPSVYPLPSVNWETFPAVDGENVRPSDGYELDSDIGSWSVVQKFGKLTVVDSKRFVPANVHGRWNQTLPHKPAPPRPPKPFHLLDGPSHNYLNLENVATRPTKRKSVVVAPPAVAITVPTVESVVPPQEEATPPVSPLHTEITASIVLTDETYDFPRSHQRANSDIENADNKATSSRHCYTNAAPSQVNGDIFRYDFHHNDLPLALNQEVVTAGNEEPTSPRSEGSGSLASTTAVYSNLPSPMIVSDSGAGGVSTPPAVNRGLKPGRKLSDSTSAISGSELSPGPLTPGQFPPSVDRKLKPFGKFSDAPCETGAALQLAPPPDGTRSLRKTRAAPSPTPPSALRNGRHRSEHISSSDENMAKTIDDEMHHHLERDRFMSCSSKRVPELLYLDLEHEVASSATQIPKSPERSLSTTTVYKSVDFLKTQAFNKTRQKVEEERKKNTPDL